MLTCGKFLQTGCKPLYSACMFEALCDTTKLASLQTLHKTCQTRYPAARILSLPSNIEDMDAAEKSQFSPLRERDMSGPMITYKTYGTFLNGRVKEYGKLSDPHLSSYDCTGSISLYCSMQTNVPEPFSSTGKDTHLNMPGGQWNQSSKWVSENIFDLHHANIIKHGYRGKDQPRYKKQGILSLGSTNFNHMDQLTSGVATSCRNYSTLLSCDPCFTHTSLCYSKMFSSNVQNEPNLSRKEKLKRAVKEYGATVIVFHVGISLISLGGFYLAASSGLEFTKVINNFGGGDVAAEAGTFVVAYAVHKMFAPVRISITLASTPFIVRYLRKIGFLKPPKVT